ncbi:MFS transporter [Sphingomonas sp. Xoc002]|uniref:MFS transporter n=1 Tax=Sphingomonas sp. Xoc002 TaxID=2837624 RepID=UPI003D186FE0
MRERDTAPPAPGFWTLASVEGWERCAIQGAKSLLTLFLVTDLLVHGRGVIGLSALRRGIEGVTGAHGDIAFASQLYGLYGALTYLVLPLGGWIADRSGRRRFAMYVGAMLMTLGLLALASRSWALPGLALLIGGIGLLKGNLAAEVGALRGRAAGERLYAAYLAFLNGGALSGPLIGGWLALRFGFAAAFVVMAASMVAAMLTLRTAPPVRLIDAREADQHRTDWPRVILAIIAVTLCFCAYEQLNNMVLLWAEQRVDLTLGTMTVPPSWLAAADGLFTIALALLAYRLWPRLSREPSAAHKLAAGGMAMVLAYALLAWLSGGAMQVGLIGPVCAIALLAVGVVLSWPSALAIVAAAAPPSRRGLMTGLFYLHGFVAHLVVGQLGTLYPRMEQPHFWLIHAGFGMAGAMIALLIPRGQATTTSTPASASA